MDRIIVNKISKYFNTNKQAVPFLKSLLSVKLKNKNKNKSFKVLDDISFKVKKGEILGFIGANGCGKSTLLRTIAGIYKQDSGEIKINGKIISIINLNQGLEVMLTTKENIYLINSLFGLNKKEIDDKFNSIIQFSDLGKFINTKLYKFSNGMLQRLVFSVAIHSNPDILLLDEVFEVGDENFRKKGVKKVKELVKKGMSVILVTHDLNMIKKYCNSVIWLEKGKIKFQNNPDKVISNYLKNN